MQENEKTFPLREILTNEEILNILYNFNGIQQWLNNDAWSAVLNATGRNIISGRAARNDLEVIISTLAIWQTMQEKLPEEQQDAATAAKMKAISEKVQKLYDAPTP